MTRLHISYGSTAGISYEIPPDAEVIAARLESEGSRIGIHLIVDGINVRTQRPEGEPDAYGHAPLLWFELRPLHKMTFPQEQQ